MKRAICFLMLVLICIPGCLAASDTMESEFCLQIQNEDGKELKGAQVWLYLLETGQLVDRGESDRNGICTFDYVPDEIVYEENGLSCVDYIAYVEADGYIPCQHYMTKIYDEETSDSSGGLDTIVMGWREESANADVQNMQQEAYDKQVYEYCLENGKITEESPLYILTAEDEENLAALGIEEPPRADLLLTVEEVNAKIPIGEYCVDSRTKLDVTYSARDKVTIKLSGTGVGANVKVRISGQTTRTIGIKTAYPTFTSTKSTPVKKTYFTYGTLERTTTVSGSTTVITYALQSINGGTAFSSASNCYLCGADFGDAITDYGACIPILDGGSVELESFADKVFELDVDITVNGASTGLTTQVTTTSGTTAKYAPKSGYDLCLYESPRHSYRWHVASRPAIGDL